MNKNMIGKSMVFALLIILFHFLYCLKIDNPVSPNYNGDYGISITNQPPSTELEILKDYTVSFKNSGKDSYWKFYFCSSSPIDPSRIQIKESAGLFTFSCSETYNGKLFIVGQRPNDRKDTFFLFNGDSVKIVNPYSIAGEKRAGYGDTLRLSVYYKGNPITSPIDTSIKVSWKDDGTNTKPIYSPYDVTIKENDTISTKIINAELMKDSLSFPLNHSITIFGRAPKIDSVSPIGSLHLGLPAQFFINCNKSNLRCIITGKNDTLFNSIIETSRPDTIFTNPISDTYYDTIKIKVVDSDGLEHSKEILNVKVNYDIPVVKFRQEDSIQSINDPVTLIVNNDADMYHWRHGDKTDSSESNVLTLPPYTNSSRDTLYVYGENIEIINSDTIHIRGPQDTLIISPRSFEYRIIPKSIPTYVKTKAPNIFRFAVIHGKDDTIADNLLQYNWQLSDTAGSGCQLETPINGEINIRFKNATKFTLRVQATYVNHNDTIKGFAEQFAVHTFSPTFSFTQNTVQLSQLKDPESIAYTANDSLDGSVTSISYRQIYPSKDSTFTITYGSTIFFKFKSDTVKIEGWASDNDSNASNRDTIIYIIKMDRPVFSTVDTTLSVTTGKSVTLKAKVKLDENIEKYYWDTNGDFLWDDSTDTNSYPIKFSYEIDTVVHAQCRNAIDSAISIMTFHINVRNNPPKVDIFPPEPTTHYVYKKLTFRVEGDDPDSGLTSLYLFRSKSSTDSVPVDSIIYTPVSYEFDTALVDTCKIAGIYSYFVIAKDCNGFSSKSTIVTDTIKQGLPVIDSVKPDTVYIYDSCTIKVSAHDNDMNLLYAISYTDTNSSSFSSFQSDSIFADTFTNSGYKSFFVKVKDINSQTSTYRDSIYINPGTPVILSSTHDSAIYIGDNTKFTVISKDYNGNITGLYADWNGDSKADDSIIKKCDTLSITKKFLIPDTLINAVYFRVIDDDGILSPWKACSITILKGTPNYTGHRSSEDIIYSKHSTTFSFSCNDTDGTIRRCVIDWKDGKTTDTAVSPSAHEYTLKTNHTYTITKDSTYRITITLTDDDGVTASFTDTICVLSDMPKVTIPGGGDTLFAPISKIGGSCPIKVSAHDPNGQIVRYYWYLSPTTLDTNSANYKSSDSLYPSPVIPAIYVNKRYCQVSVLVKDNEGNTASTSFQLFPDGPPDTPSIVVPTDQSIYAAKDTVTFEWYCTDAHDGTNLKFKLLLDPPDPPGQTTPQKPITDEISSSSPLLTRETVNGLIHFKYRYFPIDGIGSYKIQIQAIDQCGSITASKEQSFYHN